MDGSTAAVDTHFGAHGGAASGCRREEIAGLYRDEARIRPIGCSQGVVGCSRDGWRRGREGVCQVGEGVHQESRSEEAYSTHHVPLKVLHEAVEKLDYGDVLVLWVSEN